MSASQVVFLFLLAGGAGFFALNVQRLVRYMRLGQAESRTNEPLTRLKNVLTIGIAQTKIFRDPVAGAMHATIFWGFMVLTAGTVEIRVQGVLSKDEASVLAARELVEADPALAEQVGDLISHVFPLARAEEAIGARDAGLPGFIKAAVDPWS
jgi:hypothetical protein